MTGLFGGYFHITKTMESEAVASHNQEAISKHMGTFGYLYADTRPPKSIGDIPEQG